LLNLALLFLPRDVRANASVFLVSLAVTLYTANIVLAVKAEVDQVFPMSHWLNSRTAVPHVSSLAQFARLQGRKFDTRRPYDVMVDLRQSGIDAWFSFSAALLFKDWPRRQEIPLVVLDGEPALPLGGISNKVVVHCNENGSYILLDNDEHGFSNPRGLWSLPQLDIAVIGDSFAHGACVPKEDSFSAVLRHQFPATLNLGNDANGPLTELATIREYLPGLRPRIVLWTYCETNDLSDLSWESRGILIKYLDANYSQDLLRKQERIDQELMRIMDEIMAAGTPGGAARNYLNGMIDWNNYLHEFEHIVKLSHVRSLLVNPRGPRHVQVAPMLDRHDVSRNLVMLENVLRLGRDEVRSWGGELLFVYLPQWERYSEQGRASPYRQQVLDITTQLGISIIDIHEVFARQPDPLDLFPFRQPAHYNSKGYQLVANEIKRHLASRLPSHAMSGV